MLSDGYQSGVISFVNLFLTKIYGDAIFTSELKSRLSYSMFVGAIVGQVGKLADPYVIIQICQHIYKGFGLVIDRVGRKIGLVSTTFLVILGATLCAASSGTSPTGLIWMMIISRGVR